jgi:hypothetical protein
MGAADVLSPSVDRLGTAFDRNGDPHAFVVMATAGGLHYSYFDVGGATAELELGLPFQIPRTPPTFPRPERQQELVKLQVPERATVRCDGTVHQADATVIGLENIDQDPVTWGMTAGIEVFGYGPGTSTSSVWGPTDPINYSPQYPGAYWWTSFSVRRYIRGPFDLTWTFSGRYAIPYRRGSFTVTGTTRLRCGS